MVTVDSYYLNVIVKLIIDHYLSTEDNTVALSGKQYLVAGNNCIRLFSCPKLILCC